MGTCFPSAHAGRKQKPVNGFHVGFIRFFLWSDTDLLSHANVCVVFFLFSIVTRVIKGQSVCGCLAETCGVYFPFFTKH